MGEKSKLWKTIWILLVLDAVFSFGFLVGHIVARRRVVKPSPYSTPVVLAVQVRCLITPTVSTAGTTTATNTFGATNFSAAFKLDEKQFWAEEFKPEAICSKYALEIQRR
jgi:hypothetical protein